MTRLAEFELAAACCRWPPGPEKMAAVRAAGAGIDWPHFEKVVRRHRIEPLALRAIEEAGLAAPPETLERLKSESARVRRDNLLLAGECERLRRHLEKAGIDHLFVKGLAIARLAYGGIDLKKGWDVDLLVSPEDVDRTGDLLSGLGYVRTLPAGDAAADAVAAWKQRRIAKLAVDFLARHQLHDRPCRFDVGAIDVSGATTAVDVYTHAFDGFE